MSMSKYTPEHRAAVLAAGRAAIADVEATTALDEPRPEIVLPPVEDRIAKWKREADEAALARKRAKADLAEEERQHVTDHEAQRLEPRLVAMVAEQRDFFLRLLPEVVAELQHRFEQKVAELRAEIGELRADRTLDRALAKPDNLSEVIDLPALPLRRRA
jgi:hypothetical protein